MTQQEKNNIEHNNEKAILTLRNNSPEAARPENLPAKFWDEQKKTVRLDEMAKSYKFLEQQHSRLQQANEQANLQAKNLAEQKEALEKERDAMATTARDANLFGGDWQSQKSSTVAWAENIFGKKIAAELTATAEGVNALQWLRRGMAEPHLLPTSGAGNGGNPNLDEAALRRLMKRPSYWRDKKPDVLQKVEKGFDRLYGAVANPRRKI